MEAAKGKLDLFKNVWREKSFKECLGTIPTIIQKLENLNSESSPVEMRSDKKAFLKLYSELHSATDKLARKLAYNAELAHQAQILLIISLMDEDNLPPAPPNSRNGDEEPFEQPGTYTVQNIPTQPLNQYPHHHGPPPRRSRHPTQAMKNFRAQSNSTPVPTTTNLPAIPLEICGDNQVLYHYGHPFQDQCYDN